MSPKKLALWFLIVSVALSAAFGIITIITGTFGAFEGRVILTTITISAASMCALAAGAFWESRGARTLPGFAVAFAILAAVLIIIGVWGRFSWDEYWKSTATVGVLAIASAQACLISPRSARSTLCLDTDSRADRNFFSGAINPPCHLG